MAHNDLGILTAPVVGDVAATCATCGGMRWLKHYQPPYGSHSSHDERCNRKYGYCLRPCPACASGIKGAQQSGQTYTWLDDDPGDLPGKSLASFDAKAQPQAHATVSAWLDEALAGTPKLKNILLAGPPGTGKTHLVAALVNALSARGVACLFASCASYFEAFYAASFEEKHVLMRRASEIGVLALDDLDKVYVKASSDGEYQKKQFYAMLNRRYVAGLPTLITTNAEASLKTWLDGATISRLFERAHLVTMRGDDYRLKKGGAK